MALDSDALVAAALDPESSGLAEFIAGLPRSSAQQQAVNLASSRDLESRVYALRAVCQDLSVGGDPELAAEVASLGLRFCREAYDQHGPGLANSYVFGVGQFAIDAHRSLERMHARERQLGVVEDALQWLRDNDAPQDKRIDLRFARIEALMAGGDLETAREALDEERERGNEEHHLFGLLEHRLAGALQSATELKDDRSAQEQAGADRRASMAAAFEGLGQLSPEFAGMFAKLKDQLDAEPDEQDPAEAIRRANRAYEQMGSFLDGMAGGGGGAIALNARIQRASAVLAGGRTGHDPGELTAALETLTQVRREALEAGFADTATDTLWPLFICHKRLGDTGRALEALVAIRADVETRRDLIHSPLERAGISAQYPHLYVEVCAQSTRAGDPVGVLSAIEEAKGRALADQLAIDAQREERPWPSRPAAEWLPERMSELGAHYLTYLVDETETFAALVDREGGVHSSVVPLGAEELSVLRRDLAPARWGKSAGVFGRRPDDVPQQLSPLVSWLEPLFERGVLRADDHICYAPEGLLHLVPLHYVDLGGAPLIERVSLSRTHGAALLWHATREDAVVPGRHIAVTVPAADEVQGAPDKVRALSRASEWLGEHFQAEQLGEQPVDLAALASVALDRAVVHFATHGRFPDAAARETPYRASGLLLARDGHLPSKGGAWELFSPERILEGGSPFDFDGSHVTLQACVSGLAEEGVGGDALGLEWGLLMAGARSVLSTHWQVPADGSAEFSTRFYQAWLVEGGSRAAAWREAARSLMSDDPFTGESAYEWASFSLTGDWR